MADSNVNSNPISEDSVAEQIACLGFSHLLAFFMTDEFTSCSICTGVNERLSLQLLSRLRMVRGSSFLCWFFIELAVVLAYVWMGHRQIELAMRVRVHCGTVTCG